MGLFTHLLLIRDLSVHRGEGGGRGEGALREGRWVPELELEWGGGGGSGWWAVFFRPHINKYFHKSGP